MNRDFNPEMLFLAREMKAMTQTELALKTGLSQGTISKFHHGEIIPTEEDTKKLADALGFPVGFLCKQGKRIGTLDGHTFHRKKVKASASDVRRIDAHLDAFRIFTKDLLSDFDIETEYTVPVLDLDDYDQDPELVAEAIRTMWKIPSGPINNLIYRLEAAGCFVYGFDFGIDDIDENVQRESSHPPIIMYNTRAPGDRIRWSLAHALGHLVMHYDSIPHSDREDEANAFASAFLMPRQDIVDDLVPVTLERLFELKSYWKVSAASMIMRAYQLGEISERRKRTLFQQMNKSRWRKSEPNPISKERPKLIYDIFKIYREQLSFTDSDLSSRLELPTEYFRMMYYPEASQLKVI